MAFSTALRNLSYRHRGFWVRLYLGAHGCKVGSGLKCRKWPIFRNVPKRNIEIGNNVHFGYFITFEVTPAGKITIGHNVDFTHNVIISANRRVEIGNDCMFAENVSIRDSSHGTSKREQMARQASKSETVLVGNDVWIGAGSQVLMGSNVPEGVVIGAQSIVSKKSALEEYGIYAGRPVAFIKKRD
jgi:acetyltransferase-like isoleucine patch superfamily enzyme